jgi:hypothetical protein
MKRMMSFNEGYEEVETFTNVDANINRILSANTTT